MPKDPFVVASGEFSIPTDKNGEIDTNNLVVHFGKHEGELWTRVPLSYLKFCVNSMDKKSHGNRIAQAELRRRGTTSIDKLEVSYHAIDRASLHFIERFFDEANEGEGLHAWLYRRAEAALPKINKKGVAIDNRIKFVFATGNKFHTLKTVIPTHKK